MGRYGGRKMETNKVSIGSLLDERYEIKRILEADSDTARYEGWHQRVQKKVLIQEVDLQKEDIEEILFRARQLGDFSDMSGLCHVSDQFEAGDKAYIIYDYPEPGTVYGTKKADIRRRTDGDVFTSFAESAETPKRRNTKSYCFPGNALQK